MAITLNGTTGITTPDITSTTSTLGALTQALDLGSTGQIVFPATQNASANANTLDDYEEGTWTPNVVNNGSSSTFTVKIGRYIKVGNLVTATFNLDGGLSGSATGALILTGLPFSAAGNGNWQNHGSYTSNNQASGPVMMQGSGGSAFQLWTSAASQELGQKSYVSATIVYYAS